MVCLVHLVSLPCCIIVWFNQIYETDHTDTSGQPVLTLHGCPERRMGTGASLGEKAVLADSERVSVIAAGIVLWFAYGYIVLISVALDV